MKTEIAFIDEDTLSPEEVVAEEAFEKSEEFYELFPGGIYNGQTEE